MQSLSITSSISRVIMLPQMYVLPVADIIDIICLFLLPLWVNVKHAYTDHSVHPTGFILQTKKHIYITLAYTEERV